ncbi:glycoside hydrolase family 31 protein [Dendrothele bispora CBS 962.96]|uniref:Glycoside hydrolase family 31 protein n=1 Tax=Dendrothele bispora (strain CBS 962.96) TaxID=1314807 RepID=A0A4V4HF27_DENBC|nr:glycoside hydrolase family 31 protein [Dendrothele bispora CBS 962.96]
MLIPYALGVTTLFLLVSVVRASAGTYFQPNSTGIKIQNGFERVYVQPYGLHGIRVRASLMRDPTETEWSTILDPPIEGPGGNAGLSHDTTISYLSNATLRNGNLIAQVSLGTISFYRVETDQDSEDNLTLLTSEFTDTKARVPRSYVQNSNSGSFEAMFDFDSDVDEQFYGAGQQACCKDSSVNKKGQVVDLINWNSQVRMPVFVSNKGYLQFFNMGAQGRLEFGPIRTRYVATEATVVDHWITTAPEGDYDALQRHFTSVTGRQPIPPDWSLGYQQSKLRYWNQSQVIDVAQRFHDEQVNVSLIVIDFFNWKFFGDWSFDPVFWPSPSTMVDRVKSLTGAELMVSVWPAVEDASVNYLELQKQGLLATTRDGTGVTDSSNKVYTRLIDSTNPDAREFLWRQLNESYYSFGIKNFWIDEADGGTLGEQYENGGQKINLLPYARAFTQYYVGTQEGSGKLYPWFHQQAIDEGFQNLTDFRTSNDDNNNTDLNLLSSPSDINNPMTFPSFRAQSPNQPFTPFTTCPHLSLTRSTFIGGQRFCSYLWSGDTDSKFPVLLQQITAGVSVAASGISSWTLDIGGFTGLDIDSDEGRELFVRWFGMGVFLPYTRVHGNRLCNITVPTPSIPFPNLCSNEPWAYGEDNFVILKKYIALRYQLIPYVKKLFEMLHETGKTIMRPMYYDFSLSDPFVRNGTRSNDPRIIYQFMMGPRLLIAPVGEPGVTTKEVYLPKLPQAWIDQRFTWTHWWSEKNLGSGGNFVNVSAGLDEVPVFYLGTKEDIFSGNI